MKRFLLLLYSQMAFLSAIMAQQLTPAVIASDGGESKSGNILLTWTVGEMAVESVTGAGRLYTQGFQQPLLLVKSLKANDNRLFRSDYQLMIAPNPVQSILNITVTGSGQNEELHLSMTDILGRRVLQQKASSKTTSITVDMSGFISGIYMLSVRNAQGRIINTFKIIKTQ